MARLFLSICMLMSLAGWAGAAPRFEAVMVDGARIGGDEVYDWGKADAQPRLGDRLLLDAKNPVRWVRDTTLEPVPAPAAFVELFGGDRLPGRVLTFDRGEGVPWQTLPPHVLVEPSVMLDVAPLPTRGQVRVAADALRRVVWERRGSQRYQPGTLFFRDGRLAKFRSLRWSEGSVRLLVEQGTTQVTFDQIAELHLPTVDPWNAHFDALAVLTPQVSSRLLRVETAEGLRVTASMERFEARTTGNVADPQSWYVAIQPAWSLDAFFVRHRTIRQREFFAPHETPLSWIEPVAARQRAALSGGWRQWQVDANVQGGPLRSGGEAFAWGLGVHAHSELEFALPAAARGFRTRLGLDQVVGSGGCVRARVFLGSSAEMPLYESGLLIGSSKALDTGRLAIKLNDESSATDRPRLRLVVDAAVEDCPETADPLDIRDVFNWLEPLVDLDPALCQADTAQRAAASARCVADGWSVDGEFGKAWRLVNRPFLAARPGPAFRATLQPLGKPLHLTQKIKIDAARPVLALLIGAVESLSRPPTVELLIDGKRVGEPLVPRPIGEQPTPVKFHLASAAGREVVVEMVLTPHDDRSLLDWQGSAWIAAEK